MVIKQIGTYKLVKDLTLHGTTSVGTLPEGCYITITQIDENYRKVLGPALRDWVYWDLPVVKIQ